MAAKLIVPSLAAIALWSAAPAAHAQAFVQYCNDRYGFCVNYPDNLKMGDAPANNDGRVFQAADGFKAIASGGNNALDRTQDDEMKSYGEFAFDKITYQAKGRNWYVLSGYKAADIVYVKAYVGKMSINHLHISYPGQAQTRYSKIVEKMSRSFKPGDLGASH